MTIRTEAALFYRLVALFALLSPAAQASAPTAKPKEQPHWFICKAETDCVIVGAGCLMRGVNRFYAAEADAFYRKKKLARSCVDQNPPRQAICLKDRSQCRAPSGLIADRGDDGCAELTGHCQALMSLESDYKKIKKDPIIIAPTQPEAGQTP